MTFVRGVTSASIFVASMFGSSSRLSAKTSVAPCRANAGLMLPARDNDGAVRILNFGNLPFSQSLKDFHTAKIEERAKAEHRKASFQMVIDDVYAIGKGRLVGRPAAPASNR